MGNGMFIITTDHAGIPDIVEDGVNGIVCKDKQKIDLSRFNRKIECVIRENRKNDVISKLRTRQIKEIVNEKEEIKSHEVKNLKMKFLPLDLRPKKTRAIRRRLTKFESKLLPLKLFKRKLSFPMRKFAVPTQH